MRKLKDEIQKIAANAPSTYLRCDGCSARAVVRIRFTFGELDFCGHHAQRMVNALGNNLEIVSAEKLP